MAKKQKTLGPATRGVWARKATVTNRESIMAEKRYDIDGTEVFVGEKLLCVTAEHSFNRLQEGATYKAVADFDGTPVVFAGNGGPHSVDRFRKI
ncbi:MAG: hypothetical protein HGA90_04600 [Alphaproteobacteria bacterium]|nr:hypothetical protein [Alphaproteobacteria bacterium]